MKPQSRTYLIDTQNLSPLDRAKTEELLRASCWGGPSLTKKPDIWIVHTECSADEFSAIRFPEGCAVTDITGQDLTAYR